MSDAAAQPGAASPPGPSAAPRRRGNLLPAVLLGGALVLAAAAAVTGLRDDGSGVTAAPGGTTTLRPWSSAGVEPADYAADLLAAAQAERTAAGLPAWGDAPCAADVAAQRAAALVGQPLEHAPLDDVLAACAPRAMAAENLSRAAADPRDVATAWMGSPGHRSNVLDSALTDATAACVHDGDELVCTLVLVGDEG